MSRLIFVRWAIATVGIVVSIGVGIPVWRHVEVLARHFDSGDWETRSARISVESRLRHLYAANAGWNISLVAGSPYALPLDNVSFQSSISQIGTSGVADATILNFGSKPLAQSYTELLFDAVANLGSTTKDTSDRNAVGLLARLLRDPGQPVAPQSEQELRRARRVLSQLPPTNPVVKALDQYTKFAGGLSSEYPEFPVTVDQGEPSSWSDASIVVMDDAGSKAGKCTADVGRLIPGAKPVRADVETYPRYLELTIRRPWMYEAFLDQAASAKNPAVSQYFRAEAPLHLVAEKIWVTLDNSVSIQPSAGDRGTIGEWIQQQQCCTITCGSVTMHLAPNEVIENGQKFDGPATDSGPLLFAVISRRRSPQY